MFHCSGIPHQANLPLRSVSQSVRSSRWSSSWARNTRPPGRRCACSSSPLWPWCVSASTASWKEFPSASSTGGTSWVPPVCWPPLSLPSASMRCVWSWRRGRWRRETRVRRCRKSCSGRTAMGESGVKWLYFELKVPRVSGLDNASVRRIWFHHLCILQFNVPKALIIIILYYITKHLGNIRDWKYVLCNAINSIVCSPFLGGEIEKRQMFPFRWFTRTNAKITLSVVFIINSGKIKPYMWMMFVLTGRFIGWNLSDWNASLGFKRLKKVSWFNESLSVH